MTDAAEEMPMASRTHAWGAETEEGGVSVAVRREAANARAGLFSSERVP